MQRRIGLYFLIVPIICVAITGCGGGSNATTPAEVPVVLSIQDAPPTGVTALSFGIQITGVSLIGDNQVNASLLTNPITVNLSNLTMISTLLSNTSAFAGTYSGITVTFAVPQLTILNNSGATLSDGTHTCTTSTSTSAPCPLTPSLSSMSVNITGSPFPLVLRAGVPVNIALDFLGGNSIQNTGGVLSINPSVTVTASTSGNSTGIANFTNATGQVTSASNGQLVVTDLSTGQPINLTSNASTTFTGYNTSATCTTANTFACIQNGQIVNFTYGVSGTVGTSPTLQSINFNSGITSGVTGTVVSVNQGGNQLGVVIESETPSFQMQNPSVKIGQLVLVSPSGSATYSSQTNGATQPAGLTFTGINNVSVGQMVLLDVTSFTAGSGSTPGTVNVDRITLVPSQFCGTVGTLNLSGSNQNFSLTGLNGLFTQNAQSSVTVDVGSNTAYTGITGPNIGILTSGNNSCVNGLLYSTTGGPVLFGNQVSLAPTP